MLILFLLSSVLSNKYLEYRLSKNHGEIIYDFSLNKRHATNGNLVGPDSNDCFATDRGLYFANFSSNLKLPMNNISFEVEYIPLPYQMIFWMNLISGPGTIALRVIGTVFWVLNIQEDNFMILYFFNSPSLQSTLSNKEIPLGTWTLFSLQVFQSEIKLYLNQILYLSLLLNKIYEETGKNYSCGIGSDGIKNSPNGFLWYLAILIDEDSSEYIHMGSSSECLSGKYCTCNPAIKFNNTVGCVSTTQDLKSNSDGENCLNSNCYGGIIKGCKCISQSCSINADIECQCLNSTNEIIDNCLCPDGVSCCNDGCSKCENPNLCS